MRQDTLIERDLIHDVVAVFYGVYNELGFGFLESVYRQSMRAAFEDAGLPARCEVPLEVVFRGRVVGSFKADFVVANRLVVELKAAKALDPSHEAQLLNYLRATTLEVGILLNFGHQPKFRRLVFSNSRKSSR